MKLIHKLRTWWWLACHPGFKICIGGVESIDKIWFDDVLIYDRERDGELPFQWP